MVQMHAVEERIRSFLLKHFPSLRTCNLGRNDQLLGNEILDSLAVLEIVTFLEHEFEITIIDDDLLPENFQSIESLIALVERKTNGGSSH